MRELRPRAHRKGDQVVVLEDVKGSTIQAGDMGIVEEDGKDTHFPVFVPERAKTKVLSVTQFRLRLGGNNG